MYEFYLVLQQQFNYFKGVLGERYNQDQSQFQDSLRNPVFPEEQTALQVFTHGVDSLYFSSKKIMNPKIKEHECKLASSIAKKENLYEGLLEAYQIALDAFEVIVQTFSADRSEEEVQTTFPNRIMKLHKWVAINVFHTVGHIAQAMRIQAIYLRNIQN
jgi:hypothetical protein